MNCSDNTLWRITVDTNPEDCNYHCIMCEEHSGFSDFKKRLGLHRRMPVEWIPKIFEQAAKLGVKEIIPSTMGEPLLYKGIDLFFQYAKQYGMKINLTTNGSFPGKPMDEWARMIIPVTSDVKISINGATKETSESIMVGSNFKKQIENIRTLVGYRNEYCEQTGIFCRVTLQLTFMQSNMHELADIIKMAASLDVDRIKGHHLWTHFEEIKPLSMKSSEESVATWNGCVEEAISAQDVFRKPNGQKVLLENITPLVPENVVNVPVDSECPFLGRELWISAEGIISPCCAPDNLRKSLGYFGNFQDVTIGEVMGGKTYQELLHNYKDRHLCRTCNMRR